MRVLILADDLIWSTRLIAHVRAAGADPTSVRTLAALDQALPGADAVIVDLTARAYDGVDAVLKVAGRPLERRPIAELMTRDPVVLRHDDTIAVAINKMAVGGFRHIPIVDDNRPTGLVSARDVFRHLAESLG